MIELPINQIIQGDCLEKLNELPDECIDCIVTSPPYWALRNYGVEGQLGLESTFQEYIIKLCNIFDEVKRVLKKEGTCFVNLGDTYFGGGNNRDNNSPLSEKQSSNRGATGQVQQDWSAMDYQDKCLCLIPERFAIEMINRGWILRNTIIWHKKNVMPSSVKDRFTVDFEYVFFFTKSKKYYFETQFEPIKDVSKERMGKKWGGSKHEKLGVINNRQQIIKAEERMDAKRWTPEQGRNMRSVWDITIKGFSGAHFAVYPEKLCETPIKAGCPEFVCNKCGKGRKKILEPTEEYSKFLGKGWHDHFADGVMGMGQQTRGYSNRKGNIEGIKRYNDKGYSDCGCNEKFSGGIVLDPFFGAGTTGLVALKLNRSFIGFELSSEYIKIAEERLRPYLEQTKLEVNNV